MRKTDSSSFRSRAIRVTLWTSTLPTTKLANEPGAYSFSIWSQLCTRQSLRLPLLKFWPVELWITHVIKTTACNRVKSNRTHKAARRHSYMGSYQNRWKSVTTFVRRSPSLFPSSKTREKWCRHSQGLCSTASDYIITMLLKCLVLKFLWNKVG